MAFNDLSNVTPYIYIVTLVDIFTKGLVEKDYIEHNSLYLTHSKTEYYPILNTHTHT